MAVKAFSNSVALSCSPKLKSRLDGDGDKQGRLPTRFIIAKQVKIRLRIIERNFYF